MLCISAAYAVVRCPSVRPSVCLSVTFVYSVETSKHIVEIFSLPSIHTILVCLYQTLWQYSDGDPLTGRQMQVGCEKSTFSTNVSLHRVLSTVQPLGVINRMLIGTCSTQVCYFE